jgi:anaerobic glycerol-3-phosphate dehydrogenase
MTAMECDVLVIGHGAAGCLAAAALAGKGLEVVVVGRGTPATELSTARVSVPPDDRRAAALFAAIGEDHGLYRSAPGRTRAITNLGTVGSQDLNSGHDWLEVLGGRTAVLGLRGNDALDPDLACRSLSLRLPTLECEPYWADPGVPASIDAGAGGKLSEEAVEAVDLLASVLSQLDHDTVVLPPLFLGPRHAVALDRLERLSGRRVREPATPMAVPGRRLQACLEAHAVRSGCRLLKGREVRGLEFDGRLAAAAAIRSGLREQTVRFRAAVMASGNLVGGGLAVAGGETVDAMGVFAVAGHGGGAVLTSALCSGLRHRDGRAVRADGTAVTNVVLAGSCRPGMSFPCGAGLGEMASSALDAAELAAEAL